MTIHQTIAGQPADERFCFAVGQCVDHMSGGLTAIVIGMTITSVGRHVYAVEEIATGDTRYFMGSVLRPAA